QHAVCPSELRITIILIPVGPDAAIVTGQNNFQPDDLVHVLILKIMAPHSQSLPYIPDVPPFFAEYADARRIIRDRMDLAGQQFQKSGFPSAIRTEDGDVFTHLDGQREVIEDTGIRPI